jgi:hypothetical protein
MIIVCGLVKGPNFVGISGRTMRDGAEEEIPFVDKRAIVILLNYLLKRNETSLWSTYGKEWNDLEKLRVDYKEFLDHSFKSALELSL